MICLFHADSPFPVYYTQQLTGMQYGCFAIKALSLGTICVMSFMRKYLLKMSLEKIKID